MSLSISNFVEQANGFFAHDFETIKKTIYEFNMKNSNKISFKVKDNMMVIFNDFVKTPTKDSIFNNSRSIVLTNVDGKYKIVAYTHPIVDYNNFGKLVDYSDRQFVECYEGSLISVYYCNDKWNYSTRKCLDANDSFWTYNGKQSAKSHYDMFVESLTTSLPDFETGLDKTKSYYFVLVHHENKTFVDYTAKFGAEYKKSFLLFSRDAEMKESFDFPASLDSYVDKAATFTCDQIKANIETDSNVMGYLLNDGGQFYVYHTKFYENLEKAAPYAYSYENMLVELYKRDTMDAHFAMFPENVKYHGTTFDTKGVMYGVFTYMSYSLLNLYFYFTTYDGTKLGHRNEDDFKKLFEDRNHTLQSLLYKMKGMVLSQKRKLEIADVKKLLKFYINTPDVIRCLKEFEEVKKTDMAIFMKMNPKYKENAIVQEFVKHL